MSHPRLLHLATRYSGIVATSRPSREERNDRSKERRANDRPYNREGLSSDIDHEQFRQIDHTRQPRPEERPNKAHDCRNHHAAQGVASNGLTNCTTDGSNHQQD